MQQEFSRRVKDPNVHGPVQPLPGMHHRPRRLSNHAVLCITDVEDFFHGTVMLHSQRESQSRSLCPASECCQARYTAGEEEIAFRRYSELLELEPAGPHAAWAHFYRSGLYQQRGDLEAANADYFRALELDPRILETVQAE